MVLLEHLIHIQHPQQIQMATPFTTSLTGEMEATADGLVPMLRAMLFQHRTCGEALVYTMSELRQKILMGTKAIGQIVLQLQ